MTDRPGAVWVEGLQSPPQVAVKPQHGQEVDVCEEDVRCVDLLHPNVAQEVHWIEILKRRERYPMKWTPSLRHSLNIMWKRWLLHI